MEAIVQPGDTKRRDRRRAAGLACLLAVSAACFLAPLVLSSCGRQVPPSAEQQPPAAGKTPTIRVLLTRGAVDSGHLATTAAYCVRVDGRVEADADAAMPITGVRRRGGTWHLGGRDLPGRTVVVEGVGESFVQYGRTLYRGRLRLVAEDESTFRVVNAVDLESYLAGVLPRELYADWSLRTYRALAVAARTFALYQMRNFGARHAYDVTADTGSQVYGGLSAETDRAWRAVQSTHGVALACGPPGRERVFCAQYSACCGGVVNAASVLRTCDDIEPLRGGQRCEDCKACKRYRWPAVRVTKAHLYDALRSAYRSAEALGGVRAVRVTKTTDYGRAVWVTVHGTRPGKTLRIRAEGLRLALLRFGGRQGAKLYSMNCTIRDRGEAIEFADGRGFGHGVGLCQWGAQGKAKKGWSAEQILAFYYPGAVLLRAY